MDLALVKAVISWVCQLDGRTNLAFYAIKCCRFIGISHIHQITKQKRIIFVLECSLFYLIFHLIYLEMNKNLSMRIISPLSRYSSLSNSNSNLFPMKSFLLNQCRQSIASFALVFSMFGSDARNMATEESG